LREFPGNLGHVPAMELGDGQFILMQFAETE
jgi:hypothetical protein